MQRIHPSFIMVLSFMATLLNSCSLYTSHANRTDAATYVDKPMRLSTDMLLAETKHWNPANNGRYWVFSFAQTPYHTNYLNATVPSQEQYNQHPETWRAWTGNSLSGWSRWVGVLSKETQFHVADIVPKGEGNGYWVTIELDSGEYKGKTAIYANSKSLIPGMYE